MSKRKESRKQREQTPGPSEETVKPARTGKKWLLLLVGLVGAGAAVLLIADPFSRPDGSAPDRRNPDGPQRRATAPPPRPTAEALKTETLDVGRKLVADFPGQPDPLGLMGTACSKLGQQAEAVTWFKRSLDLNPNLAEAYYAMAEASIRAGEYELAAKRCRKALEIHPRLLRANGRLGQVLMELGRPEEAVAALKAELKLSPQAFGLELPLGQAYMQLKRYEQALPHLERAARHMPENPLPCYALATAYARVGRPEMAGEYRQRFRQLRTKVEQAHRARRTKDRDRILMSQIAADIHTAAGQIYAGKGRQKLAEEHWARAAFLDKNNARCRQVLSAIAMRRKQWPKALELCNELLRIEPNNAVYHLNMGVALAYSRRLDESEKAIRHAIRLQGDSVAGYHALLRVLMHENRKLPEAKAAAQKLVTVEPTARNYVLLSNLCGKTGDGAGALAAMKQALRLAPGNPQIERAYKTLKERR